MTPNNEVRKRGRPKVMHRMKRVNISVEPSDYEAVESLANANGMSTATLIRLAIKELLRAKSSKGGIVTLGKAS